MTHSCPRCELDHLDDEWLPSRAVIASLVPIPEAPQVYAVPGSRVSVVGDGEHLLVEVGKGGQVWIDGAARVRASSDARVWVDGAVSFRADHGANIIKVSSPSFKEAVACVSLKPRRRLAEARATGEAP